MVAGTWNDVNQTGDISTGHALLLATDIIRWIPGVSAAADPFATIRITRVDLGRGGHPVDMEWSF